MNVSCVNLNYLNFVPTGSIRQNPVTSKDSEPAGLRLNCPLMTDTISFSGISHGGDILKRLSAYGVIDMYTGLKLLDSKTLESMQRFLKH